MAYLDGELDHRVLVICDMFNRHKESTFEYLAFAPELFAFWELSLISFDIQK